MIFSDAHIHITDLDSWQPLIAGETEEGSIPSPVCSCAHCEKDWKTLSGIAEQFPGTVVKAAGIHPQNPDKKHAAFLLAALEQNQADAVGEAGFDLFTPEYGALLKEQEEVWALQLEAARRYDKPLIIHCRKALHLIFSYANVLKKLKAVIFHGWAGNVTEASSLLKKGVNAYFCIGKALLRGQKSQIEMASSFDALHLLTETDAPYMALKGEAFSSLLDISKVVEGIADLRRIGKEELKEIIFANFKKSMEL